MLTKNIVVGYANVSLLFNLNVSVSDLEDLYCRYTNNTVFVLDTADTCGVSEASTLRLLFRRTRISQYT